MNNLKNYKEYLKTNKETIENKISSENKEKLLKLKKLFDRKETNCKIMINSAHLLSFINPDLDFEDFLIANALIKSCILLTIFDLIENEDLILIDKGDKKNE